MQQQITNGEGGLPVRTALNGNFTELYGAIQPPLKLNGINANAQAAIPANSYIIAILIQPVAGAPVINVGTTPAGVDLLPATNVVQTIPIQGIPPFDAAGTIYFTLAGGTVNVSIIYQTNIY